MKETFLLENGGLELVGTFETAGGTLTATLGWADLKTAQEHYEDAKEALRETARKRSREFEETGKVDTTRSRVHTPLKTANHRVHVFINTGPPTWWTPNIGFNSAGREIRFGWLRVAVIVWISDRTH